MTSSSDWGISACIEHVDRLYRNSLHDELAALIFAHLERVFSVRIEHASPRSIETFAHHAFFCSSWADETLGVGGRLQMTEASELSNPHNLGATLGLVLTTLYRDRIIYSRADRLFREELSEIVKLAQSTGFKLREVLDRCLPEHGIQRDVILQSRCLLPVLDMRGRVVDADDLIEECVKNRKQIISSAEQTPTLNNVEQEHAQREQDYASAINTAAGDDEWITEEGEQPGPRVVLDRRHLGGGVIDNPGVHLPHDPQGPGRAC